MTGRLLRYFRHRPWAAFVVGALLELAAMGALAPFGFAEGTPGGIGVAIAVLAALAAGPRVGVAVALVGWLALFFFVAEREPVSLVALAIWPATAYVVGLLARTLGRTELELGAREREGAELRRLDLAKTQFVALASHELRTPVAVIAGIASTLHLRGDLLDDDQRDELRRTLYEQAARLATLTEQLLDLSRLDADVIEIDPKPFFVRTRVEENLLLAAGERAREVALEVPPDLQVKADARAFDRIVSNLITNALRYGEAPVVVRAMQQDRHFRLAVEDQGGGVAPDFVPRLFDRFARGEAAKSRRDGTGLGLAIARSYARAHGGDLVYSPAEPAGSKFELVLPRSP